MGVMIGTTVVVAILTLIGTVVWWAMMNRWVEKDKRCRGRHVTEWGAPGLSGGRPEGGPESRRDDDRGEGPRVMKL